jgi:hypothetical protein
MTRLSDPADHELRKAYNCIIESATTHFWDRKAIPGVNPDEVITFYKHAFQEHRKGNSLASERWARTAKHLSRALWSEAKIAYLAPRLSNLPYLTGATAEEYLLFQRSDTTQDLLDSVADHIPPGLTEMPEPMLRYLKIARRHIESLTEKQGDELTMTHELLRAEHIKAAYEYGRVLECMALAYEAESTSKKTAA